VLKHAEAGDLVEGQEASGGVAVVEQLRAAALGDLGGTDACGGDSGLLLADGDALGFNVVMRGGVQGQAAPAAADVEEAVGWREAELAADQLELVGLGGGETVLRRAEVGAGVDQRIAEPGAEEIDGLVVVMGDGGAVALDRVRRAVVPPVGDLEDDARERLQKPAAAALRAVEDVFGDAEDGEEIAFDVDVAGEIGLAQGDLAGTDDQRLEGARSIEDEGALRRGVAGAGPLPAVPETDRKGRTVLAREERIEDLRAFTIRRREHRGEASPVVLKRRYFCRSLDRWMLLCARSGVERERPLT
jgi:hypothetical protein